MCDPNYVYLDNPCWLLLLMTLEKSTFLELSWKQKLYIQIVCGNFLVTLLSCKLYININKFSVSNMLAKREHWKVYFGGFIA